MLPLRSCSPYWWAALRVIARTASRADTRCSDPRTTSSVRVRRVTWLDSTAIEFGNATGASWCEV